MAKTACIVPITQIILDEEIYPRSGVYPKRVSLFAENMRDGFKIDPFEVQIHPEHDDKYRILDGAHLWHAYKEIGATEISVLIIALDGVDPILYAAKKAIGHLQLTEDEAGTTARRAYENNPRLTSFEIGQAIGRSRQAVDAYIADLRAATRSKPDLIVFDPPYFKKQSNNYDSDGIAGMSKANYLKFMESFVASAHLNAKKSTHMAFINADWCDFQSTPAKNETLVNSILINDYLWILNQSGWQETQFWVEADTCRFLN
ncbi:MAG: ParB N-terminal domain-containing protein [Desulfobacteraceae bacterium]|nr:ParB N-terminal domain-containing protein [Desulfobacteraceae bacterium]MBC2719001.1 ParB N-terminal domain-containing protein [Desulfobacteraceae bacterium]